MYWPWLYHHAGDAVDAVFQLSMIDTKTWYASRIVDVKNLMWLNMLHTLRKVIHSMSDRRKAAYTPIMPELKENLEERNSDVLRQIISKLVNNYDRLATKTIGLIRRDSSMKWSNLFVVPHVFRHIILFNRHYKRLTTYARTTCMYDALSQNVKCSDMKSGDQNQVSSSS